MQLIQMRLFLEGCAAYYEDKAPFTSEDIDSIMSQVEECMRSTCGDTGPVTMTTRQATILLAAWYAEFERRLNKEDEIREW